MLDRRFGSAFIFLSILLSILLPTAAAVPADGRLVVDGPLLLAGESALAPGAGGRAVLRLDGADDSVVALAGAGASVVVEVVRWKEDRVTNPAGAPHRVQSAFETERFAFRDASVSVGALAVAELLVLEADSTGPSSLAVRDASLAGVSRAVVFPGLQSSGPSTGGTGGEAVEVEDTIELVADSLAAAMQGAFVLRAHGPALDVTSRGETRTFRSGMEETAMTPATATVTNTVLRVVWAGSADIEARGGPIAAYSSVPVVAGAVEAARATGTVVVDGARHDLRGDAFGATGAVELRAAPSGLPGLADERGVTRTSAVAVTVAGDFARWSVGSAVSRVLPVEAAVGGLLGLAALVAVAWYWPLVKYGFTAAFTRIREPDVLDNEARNHIFAIIKAKPGISARSVHRESGQSWGTVVYHLRQLERHRLVKSVRVGRLRTFYEAAGRFAGLEGGLAVLRNPRALTIARIVAASPGITQEALAMRAGFPQSTVSYYVRKLRNARLVEERREGKYVAYDPGPQLVGALSTVAPEETATLAPAPAPVG